MSKPSAETVEHLLKLGFENSGVPYAFYSRLPDGPGVVEFSASLQIHEGTSQVTGHLRMVVPGPEDDGWADVMSAPLLVPYRTDFDTALRICAEHLLNQANQVLAGEKIRFVSQRNINPGKVIAVCE